MKTFSVQWWLAASVLWWVLYLPALPEGFFLIDDERLAGAPQVRHFTLESVSSIFELGHQVDYYPVRDLSYILDWSWGTHLESNAMPARVQNLFWFLGCALLIFGLLRRLLGSPQMTPVASLITLAWLMHPIHNETLLWVSARKDVLALFGFLLFVWCALKAYRGETAEVPTKPPRAAELVKAPTWAKVYLGLSLLGVVVSLLSKATFVGAVILTGLWLLATQPILRKKPIWALYFFLMLAFSTGLLVLQAFIYTHENPMAIHVTFAYRLKAVTAAWGRYVSGLFWPAANAIEVNNAPPWADLQGFMAPFGAVTITVALLFIFFLVSRHGRHLRRRHGLYFPLLLLGIGLAATTPGLNPMHGAFYSVRYFEPFLLLGLFTLTFFLRDLLRERQVHFVLQGLVVMSLVLSAIDAGNWDSTLSILRKATAKKDVAAETLELVELVNLRRWGKISSEEAKTLPRRFGEILKACGAGVELLPEPHLCTTFYRHLPSLSFLAPELSLAWIRQANRPEMLSIANSFADLSNRHEWIDDSLALTTPDRRWIKVLVTCRDAGADKSRELMRTFFRKSLFNDSIRSELTSQISDVKFRSWAVACSQIQGGDS
ncbi:MAG: hypothetical protein C5B49_03515 [Bdellovibrio sp.]|nr:MAG: hypothetical protein C5B49_03515 [Bdellovibrio sp.]